MAATTALVDYAQQLNILEVHPGHKNKETSARAALSIRAEATLWLKTIKYRINSDFSGLLHI